MRKSILKTIFISTLFCSSLTINAQNKDWANLTHYQAKNKEIVETDKQINAIFIGNSITQNWVNLDSSFFAKNNYIGRGIGGQISAQILLRMREDVIKLKPQVLIINAGINDIAENANVYDPEITLGNIISMAQLAQANKIKVVLASILPAKELRWRTNITDVANKVINLNSQIKEYANANNITYLDYHSALKDKDNGLDSKYGEDGVHPNIEGYQIMEPLAKEAIHQALQQ